MEEVERWIADAREKLHLKNNLKDFEVLKTLPELANVRHSVLIVSLRGVVQLFYNLP